MSGGYQLQLSIYDALNGNAALGALIQGIYDNPLQVADPESNDAFPFVTISDVQLSPFDDDQDTGGDALVTIHTWSRERHALEAKQIQDAIYDVLHRGTLSISGWRFIGCDYVSQTVERDPDGITRHGVQTFRVTYEET